MFQFTGDIRFTCVINHLSKKKMRMFLTLTSDLASDTQINSFSYAHYFIKHFFSLTSYQVPFNSNPRSGCNLTSGCNNTLARNRVRFHCFETVQTGCGELSCIRHILLSLILLVWMWKTKSIPFIHFLRRQFNGGFLLFLLFAFMLISSHHNWA